MSACHCRTANRPTGSSQLDLKSQKLVRKRPSVGVCGQCGGSGCGHRDIVEHGNAGRDEYFVGIDVIEEEATRVEALKAAGKVCCRHECLIDSPM